MFLLKDLPFCRVMGHCLQQVLTMAKQEYGVEMVSYVYICNMFAVEV